VNIEISLKIEILSKKKMSFSERTFSWQCLKALKVKGNDSLIPLDVLV